MSQINNNNLEDLFGGSNFSTCDMGHFKAVVGSWQSIIFTLSLFNEKLNTIQFDTRKKFNVICTLKLDRVVADVIF